MSDAAETLRKALKKNAEAVGIHDTKAPSKIYCKVIIDYISKVTKRPVDELAQEIFAYEALANQGIK